MNRRETVFALLALGATRLSTAQPAAGTHRVAYLSLTASRGEAPFLVAMERRFRELGYIEGKNFILDFRVAGGRWDKLAETAADLAKTQPDVAISAGSEFILKAFRQAMGATPIVMIAVDFDPVAKNYIASLSRPGGNITGVYLRQLESAVKRLELLKEALPKVTRVAALFDSSTRDQLQGAETAAKKLSISLLHYELSGNPYNFEGALSAAAAAKAQAVLALSSGAFFLSGGKWIAAALKHRLPVIANTNYADVGALVAFGASFSGMWARAADYADRIMKGEHTAEMPVEQPTQYELIVNLKSAKALGITVPRPILLRADRVIE